MILTEGPCSGRGLAPPRAVPGVEPFALIVDGERVPEDTIRFSVRGRAFTFDEMASETTVRWEFGERATLTVLRPGGVVPLLATSVFRVGGPSMARCWPRSAWARCPAPLAFHDRA